MVFLNEIVTIPLRRICVMVHFLLSSLSWCFLMGSDKFCSSIIAQKLWAIEPKRFPFSIWIIVNEPIQCSPSNAHGPRPCYSLIWAKLLSSVKRTKGQLIPECLLGVINFPKKQRKIWQISALKSKKWSNQQSKSTFL